MYSRLFKKTNKRSTNAPNLFASMGLLCFISHKQWELSSSYHENIHLRQIWAFLHDVLHSAEGWADDPLTWRRFVLLGELPTGFIIKSHTRVFTGGIKKWQRQRLWYPKQASTSEGLDGDVTEWALQRDNKNLMSRSADWQCSASCGAGICFKLSSSEEHNRDIEIW